MTLITKTQHVQLLANCQAQIARMDAGESDIDFKPVVKLFTPDAQCTWLLTELGNDDIDFGLCGTPHNPNYADSNVMENCRRERLIAPSDLHVLLNIIACFRLPTTEEHTNVERSNPAGCK